MSQIPGLANAQWQYDHQSDLRGIGTHIVNIDVGPDAEGRVEFEMNQAIADTPDGWRHLTIESKEVLANPRDDGSYRLEFGLTVKDIDCDGHEAVQIGTLLMGLAKALLRSGAK